MRQAVLDGASYLGIGPTFPSRTKDFAALAGLELVRHAMAETTLPAFVLGGVDVNNIGTVIAAGGKRVAVSQAIARANDPGACGATAAGIVLTGSVLIAACGEAQQASSQAAAKTILP